MKVKDKSNQTRKKEREKREKGRKKYRTQAIEEETKKEQETKQ